jgi:hypothetical protein
MHPRGIRLRATAYAVTAFACLFVLPTAHAQEKKKEKEKEPNRIVVRYVAHKEKVPYQGKLVMVLGVESLEGGRTMELVVKNHDMNKKEYNPVVNTDNVNALQKGDAIKIELDESRPKPMVTYLKKYDLKPGEESPKVYRFQSSYKKGEGPQAYTAVVLSRFDEPVTLAVPKSKGREGQGDAGANIEDLASKLQFDEVVEAEVKDARPVPVLVSLDRYTPPQTGKFLKLSDEDMAEGQKGSAVEIEQGGKTVKALVPGKLQNKRWIPDGKVLGAVKRLKPEAEVVYRTREDGGKVWLKEIEPAPKVKELARDHDRDGARDREKEAASDDSGARRGRRPRTQSK